MDFNNLSGNGNALCK